MYRLSWYCCAILNGGRFGDLRTIYQGCRALPFALAGLSCSLYVSICGLRKGPGKFVLESPGKVLDFFSVKEWEPCVKAKSRNVAIVTPCTKRLRKFRRPSRARYAYDRKRMTFIIRYFISHWITWAARTSWAVIVRISSVVNWTLLAFCVCNMRRWLVNMASFVSHMARLTWRHTATAAVVSPRVASSDVSRVII